MHIYNLTSLIISVYIAKTQLYIQEVNKIVSVQPNQNNVCEKVKMRIYMRHYIYTKIVRYLESKNKTPNSNYNRY